MEPELRFLAAGGEMGERIRAFDWAATPLGPPCGWPQGLRTALRMALTTRHPVVVFWGPEGTCFYNDAYRPSLGPEQHPSILGRPARDAWRDIWDIVGPQIERVMSGLGSTWHENHRIELARNGRTEATYWTYSYGPIDEEGAPNGVGGVLVLTVETTPQVAAAQRLADQVVRQRHLFTKAPGFVAITEGPEHRYEFVNDTLMRLFGDRAFIGRTVREVLPELDGQGYFEALDDVFRTGERRVAEGQPARIRRPDGSESGHFLDFVYEAVRDEAGRITGVFCQGHDVTERVRAQARLRDSEERVRLLIDGARDYAIIALDSEGFITTWNAGAERMMGYTESEAVGRHTSIFFTQEDIEANAPENEMRRALEHGRVENERWHRRRDGSVFWGSGLMTPLLPGVADAGFVKIFQDRTVQHEAVAARDAALARLQEADRQKDDFVATLAHELRNPLAPIRYAVPLLRPEIQAEALVKVAGMIERQCAQMARLLDDLLDVSRISRNAIELRRDLLDLRTAVQLGIETARPLVDAARQSLEVRLPDAPLAVVGDPVRIAQIVSNLLHNAAKFTDAGGCITVEIERTPDEAVIHVCDTGVGLAPGATERIFDLFSQIDGGGGRRGGGLGIGLSLVKRLAEMHGGRVAAESPGPGLGARFSIGLPLAVADALRDDAPVGGDALPVDAALQVLVVDDNADAADALASVLEDCGVRAVAAYGGAEAMLAALSLRPGLVLLDLGMPAIDGYAVARWMREQPWGKGVLLVAITGWGHARVRELTREAGFDAHLVKPVDPREIRQILQGFRPDPSPLPTQ